MRFLLNWLFDYTDYSALKSQDKSLMMMEDDIAEVHSKQLTTKPNMPPLSGRTYF